MPNALVIFICGKIVNPEHIMDYVVNGFHR